MSDDTANRMIYGIGEECSIPSRDASGKWRAIHEPSGRVIESYAWERLVFKALQAKIAHRRAQCGESTPDDHERAL
ncbi:hypothetical protein AB0K40_13130 [Nonomuraea bangladeshensis]|uniref:Uncharacterized protein n=1 Tax=Nonomuraea bangladeshensis TaxID=404385 RepID=A0ABV3H1M7_9ACTN